MKILVGCEESQAVTIELRKLGHEAYSCDILPCSGGHPEWHIQGDVFKYLDENKYNNFKGWDLGIFFPDCTYLTCSAEWAYKEPPYHQNVKPETLTGIKRRAAREEAVVFVEKLYNAYIERIVIENPVGILSTKFQKPTQAIQPYEFGNDASKKTCLWLKSLPKLVPTEYVEGRLVCCGEEIENLCPSCRGDKTALRRWGNQTNSGQNKLTPGKHRASLRSKTYPGIAKAMAEQWAGVAE